jgi:S1-C subfamily serine protease
MLKTVPYGHITKKLKHSLLIIVGLGAILMGLLSATAGLVTYNIIQTTTNSKVAADKNLKILLQSQQKFSLPEKTSYVPHPLDQATVINVIARNQPSVVRIATIYCADITLSSKQATANFTDTCSGRVGSGSFISSDGYIATSGHVVSETAATTLVESLTTTESQGRYLSYMVASGLMSTKGADSIKSGMAIKSADARTALYNSSDLIPPSQVNDGNPTTHYAIQLSNQPISIDKSNNRLAPVYTNTVIKADLVDVEFNQVTSDAALSTGQFSSGDVAILKATGSFPYITLGNINTVKIGDQLTAIGFPTSIDGVDQALTQAVPSITQGRVTDIHFDSNADVRKIISTTVPIGQGNSGGPALNNSGQEIGINTYSAIKCADLNCYGDGQVRDITDLKALIEKNAITLKTGGIIDDWSKALTDYAKGNYADSLTYLNKVHDEYPANYLVASLLNVAKQQLGTKTDTSTSYQVQGLIMVSLAVLVASMVVITIMLIVLIILFTIQYHVRTKLLEKYDNKA